MWWYSGAVVAAGGTAGPQKEDEAFAFQRCVSRLIEMQSEEYLERVAKRKAFKTSSHGDHR